MKALGKLMQIAGLLVLPLSMVMELSDFLGRDVGVADMLVMLLFGASVFFAGRLIEGYAKS